MHLLSLSFPVPRLNIPFLFFYTRLTSQADLIIGHHGLVHIEWQTMLIYFSRNLWNPVHIGQIWLFYTKGGDWENISGENRFGTEEKKWNRLLKGRTIKGRKDMDMKWKLNVLSIPWGLLQVCSQVCFWHDVMYF